MGWAANGRDMDVRVAKQKITMMQRGVATLEALGDLNKG